MQSITPLPSRSVSLRSHGSGLLALRSTAVGLARLLSMTISVAYAAPLHHLGEKKPETKGASLWVLYLISVVLVLAGGAFAGLTIA